MIQLRADSFERSVGLSDEPLLRSWLWVVCMSSRGGFRDLHAPLVICLERSREPGTASTYTINTRNGATTLIITLN